VFLNPMDTTLYLSAAHDEQVIADVLGRLRETLADLAGWRRPRRCGLTCTTGRKRPTNSRR